MRFVGENHITIQNPNSEQVLRFNIERFGGNQLSASVKWKILRTPPYIFPSTRQVLRNFELFNIQTVLRTSLIKIVNHF